VGGRGEVGGRGDEGRNDPNIVCIYEYNKIKNVMLYLAQTQAQAVYSLSLPGKEST
jgi:hypothetical protein